MKDWEIIIIAIFIILFAIRIVANNIFGDSINFSINLCLFNVESFNLLLSEGDKAKKAISEPEINPETISRKTQDRKGVKKL